MGKNIVICCDGTGNQYGRRNTNVVELFDIAEKNSDRQVAFYDPGVGTFSSIAAVTRTAKAFTKLMGLAIAYGITRNIEDAYEYLMDQYEDGDRVYLFGFSRGAFTVRALAGMLNKCGLLQRGSKNLIGYASQMYRKGGAEEAAGFKRAFSRECKPHFIGVWDTVKSVGLIIPRSFPNSRLNTDVSFGYHALAIDEVRSKFRPNLWEPAVGDQHIEQVWFAGVHSDVGGSYVEKGLSNTALKWMITRGVEHGLLIDADRLTAIVPDSSDKIHDPRWPLYWLLGWWRRKIEAGSLVHASAFERIEKVSSYRPSNLPGKDSVRIVET